MGENQGEQEIAFKFLDDEDFFMCSAGLFPARMHDGKDTFITQTTKKHLTHFDKACNGPDFTCKWAVILAVAAAVFLALLMSNPVGWAILAGLLIGVGLGLLLCGGMMAGGREWFDYDETIIILEERHPLPSYAYMTCALGGEITWQPQITSPGMAVWTGLRNLGFATLEGVMYGYAAYGGVSLFTKAGLKAAFGTSFKTFLKSNFVQGWARTFWNAGGKSLLTKSLPLLIRGGFAAENVLYNSQTGQYEEVDEDGNKRTNYSAAVGDGVQTFFGETAPYRSVGTKIINGEWDKITGSEVGQCIAIPFSFIGVNINATAHEGSVTQIPKGLRNGAVKLKLNVKGLFKQRSYIDGVEKGSMPMEDARAWYLKKEAGIADLVDQSLPWEQKGRQAFELRNQYRTQARELMADRGVANKLNKSDPNMTWE